MTIERIDFDKILQARGFRRCHEWSTLANHHLSTHPACVVCGRSDCKRNVHHIYPFHFVVGVGRADLERDPRDFATICVDHDEEHHVLVGHLGSYESYNPHFKTFVRLCKGLKAEQIRDLSQWQKAVRYRPAPFHEMSDKEKQDLRHELDQLYPLKAA